MIYKVVPTPTFKKQAKKYLKKFHNLPNDLESLYEILSKNPREGISKGNDVYKIRLKNSDLNRGKSGGYRVITYIIDENRRVILLTIYSKSEIENISDSEIDDLIEEARNM